MDDKFARLLRWCRLQGAIIPETIQVVSSQKEGSHCVTTVEIPASTPVFQIPHSICITPAVACTALPLLKSFPATVQLSVFLAVERYKTGFWTEYLGTLPKEFSTPLYFPPEEIELLGGTNLYYSLTDRIALHKSEHEQAQKVIEIEWYLVPGGWGLVDLQGRLPMGIKCRYFEIVSVETSLP